MSAALSLPFAVEALSVSKTGEIVVVEGRPVEVSLPLVEDTEEGRSELRYAIFQATGWTVVFESRWEEPAGVCHYALRALRKSAEVSPC